VPDILGIALDHPLTAVVPRRAQGPYPLNLLSIIHNSPNLKLSDAIKSTLALPDLIYYNYETVVSTTRRCRCARGRWRWIGRRCHRATVKSPPLSMIILISAILISTILNSIIVVFSGRSTTT
jgi:hypothetical protein